MAKRHALPVSPDDRRFLRPPSINFKLLNNIWNALGARRLKKKKAVIDRQYTCDFRQSTGVSSDDFHFTNQLRTKDQPPLSLDYSREKIKINLFTDKEEDELVKWYKTQNFLDNNESLDHLPPTTTYSSGVATTVFDRQSSSIISRVCRLSNCCEQTAYRKLTDQSPIGEIENRTWLPDYRR